MTSLIKHPKDFWAGVMYVAIGAAAIVIGRDYSMGTAVRMGPAYFPSLLGGLLALVGAAAIVRSFLKPGEKIIPFAWREVVLVLASVVLFGILVRGAGLIPALLLLVMISAYASIKFKWAPAVTLAVGMTVFSVLVFVEALGVPLPLLGSWFGQ